jgi:signal transduction histidine kinase
MPTDMLRAIVGAGVEIAQSQLPFEELLGFVSRRACEVTGARGAAIALIEGEELAYHGCVGALADAEGLRVAIADSLSAKAIGENRVLYAEQVGADPRADLALCRDQGLGSLVLAPLDRGDKAICERDFAALGLLAQSAGGALQRQRMLEQLEDALCAAETARHVAEEAMAAKSDFLANMSHELRTPLTSIIGFAGLLAIRDGLGPAERRMADRITAASRHLLGVINDVLDYSKLEADAVELDPAPFDLGEFVETTVDLVAAQAEAKGLELAVEVDEGVPMIIGDAPRLRQVLLNFLSNAVKFTGTGAITVQAHACLVGAHAVEVTCGVRDTGVGVPPDRLGELFQRFVQADSSIARRFGGTGLGLAISQRLIELMGGQVGVESVEGEGSLFWFQITLPVVPKAERKDEKAAA